MEKVRTKNDIARKIPKVYSSVSNQINYNFLSLSLLISEWWIQHGFAGATTGAHTRMIKDAQQWNRCRGFKMILHCTEQPITAITLVEALRIPRLFWNLFLLLHLPRYLALITAFIVNKKTRFPRHYLHQSSRSLRKWFAMNIVLRTSCLR